VTILRDDYKSGQRCPEKRRGLWRRRIATVESVLVHATAVAGGFALAHYQIKAAGGDLEALLARYRETPYHGVYSPRFGLSVVQWAASEYTHHGNGANSWSVGWAYDGLFTTSHLDELDVDGGREALRHFIEAQREQGVELKYIDAHANHSNKPFDPGPQVWRGVVLPVAADLGLEVRPSFVTRGNRANVLDWSAS
jgi:hypothetical protein